MTQNKSSRPEPAASRNPVENYLGFSIPEDLQEELQLFLDAHVDLDEEATFSRILELGLRQMIEGDNGAHHHDEEIERTLGEIEASQRRVLVALASRTRP